jgi:hypothetical protein
MRPSFCIFGLALAWLIMSSAQAHSRGVAWFFANSKPQGTCESYRLLSSTSFRGCSWGEIDLVQDGRDEPGTP